MVGGVKRSLLGMALGGAILGGLLLPGAAEEVSPSTSTTLSSDDTSGWLTYSNPIYGFEFKIPPGFHVQSRYQLPMASLYAKKVNGSLFSVSLLKGSRYAGLSVAVIKKENLFFRSKVVPGFYKYDASLNAWLGYNPTMTEYGRPGRVYFYLGTPLCALVDTLGASAIPTYGTARLVSANDPRNDVILTDRDYGFEIPREDPHLTDYRPDEIIEFQEKVRDSFRLLGGIRPISADCSETTLLAGTTLQAPSVVKPAYDQVLPAEKPFEVVLDSPVPQGLGAVIFLSANPLADVSKIVYAMPIGNITSGNRATVRAADSPDVTPGSETASIALEVYFYKRMNGRKVLLGDKFHQTIPVNLK
jgi:hypothetical protein